MNVQPASPLDWVTAQTRLLVDPNLRAQFRSNPEQVARDLALSPVQSALFVRLSPAQLDSQARALIDKRYHETRKLLPRTAELMGKAMRPAFIEHALDYWPTGHQRHLHDACKFARSLQIERPEFVFLPEVNWLQHLASPARLRLRCVRFRSPDRKSFFGVQTLIRFAGKPRQFLFGLAMP